MQELAAADACLGWIEVSAGDCRMGKNVMPSSHANQNTKKSSFARPTCATKLFMSPTCRELEPPNFLEVWVF